MLNLCPLVGYVFWMHYIIDDQYSVFSIPNSKNKSFYFTLLSYFTLSELSHGTRDFKPFNF